MSRSLRGNVPCLLIGLISGMRPDLIDGTDGCTDARLPSSALPLTKHGLLDDAV
jgi:hypothetical protein